MQSFEHCFTKNHGENRMPNISILSCVFNTGYKIYWNTSTENHFGTRKLTFVRQKSTLRIKRKKSDFNIDKIFRTLKWLLGCFQPITLKNDWVLIIFCFSNWIERFSNLLGWKFAFKFTKYCSSMDVINFLHVNPFLSILQCMWNHSQANMFVFRIKLS